MDFNRSTYCLNNPLKYTDPNGYRYTYQDYQREKAEYTRQNGSAQFFNNYPDRWSAYISAMGRGVYSGSYGNFVVQYNAQYMAHLSTGNGGVSNAMTFTWHTWNDHNEIVNDEVHVIAEKVNHSIIMQISFGGNANNISNAGLQFIGQHEGYSSTVYNDAAGKPTIGYGHLIKPGENFNSITKPQGLQLLKNDASLAVNAVNKYANVPLAQNQFDALTSFTFNVGVGAFSGSSLLRNVNSGSIMLIENSFLMWNKARIDGVLTPVPGLTIRRQDEAGLYLYGY